jgi:hypothetical protein
MTTKLTLTLATILTVTSAHAADQSQPGAGNARSLHIASGSHYALAAQKYLTESAKTIKDPAIRRETLDALDPSTCVHHRIGIGAAEKQTILANLVAAGFVSTSDATGWGPGALNGVFPPIVNEGSACPRLPQPYLAAPGGGFHGHHSYPGGLVVHTAMNTRIARSVAANYTENYSLDSDKEQKSCDGSLLDNDLVVAAPLWHDWAKPMVFQWNADGTEFAQMTIAGSGSHHILGLAEAIARGLPPDHVAAQASAHNPPTGGAEGLVVGWIQAAALIARVDAVARGYLTTDANGKLRLPAVHHLGDVDLPSAGLMNLMAEYVVDTMSDADWIYTETALSIAETLIAQLAPRFGYDSTAASYNVKYRNVVLSNLTAERLEMVYQRDGLEAVARMIDSLHRRGRI